MWSIPKGLSGRLLSVAARGRRLAWERKCEEDEVTWRKRVRLGMIGSDLPSLVEEASNELFMLFEYWRPDPTVFRSVLNEFLNSRV